MLAGGPSPRRSHRGMKSLPGVAVGRAVLVSALAAAAFYTCLFVARSEAPTAGLGAIGTGGAASLVEPHVSAPIASTGKTPLRGTSSPRPAATLSIRSDGVLQRSQRGTLYGVHKAGGLMNIRWFLVATLLRGLRTNRTVLLPPTVSSRSAFVKDWGDAAAGWRQVPLHSIFDRASLQTCLASNFGMRVLNASAQTPLRRCQELHGRAGRCARTVHSLANVEPGDDDVLVPLTIEMTRVGDEEARMAAAIDACLRFAPAIYRAADPVVARMAATIEAEDTRTDTDTTVLSRPSLPPLVLGLYVQSDGNSGGSWDLRASDGGAVSGPRLSPTERAARVIERLLACVSSWRVTDGAEVPVHASRPVRAVYLATGLPLNSTLLQPLYAAYPGAHVLSKETIGDPVELAPLSELGCNALAAVDAAVLAHPFITFMSGAAYSTFLRQVAIERNRAGLPARLHGYVQVPAVCPALPPTSIGNLR
jgi:hypothetical protein